MAGTEGTAAWGRGHGIGSSRRQGRLWLCAFAALTLACVGLALPSSGKAIEGVEVRANATGGDDDVVATVFVGASAGRICAGGVRHGSREAKLPPLRTGDSGNGRWQWRVGDGVAAGRWQVHVRCQLASGPASARTGFTASGTGRSGPSRLVAPGSMTHRGFDSAGLSEGGRGGDEEENGYPKGQCTWWALLKRPDIPLFPGPAGDARNWAESAKRAHPGFSVGTTAKPGAIVVFQPGQAGAGTFGHVAYVVRVKGPKMTISEANYRDTKPGHQRTLPWRGHRFKFIYSKEKQRSPNPPKAPNTFRFHVYRTCANGSCGLRQRLGPELRFGVIGEPLPDGRAVDISCQTRGDRVTGFDASSTSVWDRLANGTYVPDYFISTPGKNDQLTEPLPDCATLGGQQTSSPPRVASVSLMAPANGQVLTGAVDVRASSDAPEVRFEAFYSDSPGIQGNARWHLLGVDNTPGDGFTVNWDTGAVANQGLRTEGTVRIAAIAVDQAQGITDSEDTRLVAVANPDQNDVFSYHVLGTCEEAFCQLNKRSGPGFSMYPPTGKVPEGGELKIVCQAGGETVGGALGASAVWNKLDDAAWVSDYYVDTPVAGDFSPPIPRCASVPPPPTLTIALSSPADGATLTGTAEIEAASNAPGVRFEAFYSDTPGIKDTAQWHHLGNDTTPADGFEHSWGTTAVPNQGQASQSTVGVRAIALDYRGRPTAVQGLRRVNVSNPSSDGSYAYHVYGTCGSGACFVNLRSGPSQLSYPVVGTKNEGEQVDIVCQVHGQSVSDGVRSSDIWDKLADGNWVTDFYVDTPVASAFSPPIPEC